MKAQEIFDKVATHLFCQGHRAIRWDGMCVYRGEGRDMCAVGVLIPDEDYNPCFEGCSLYAIKDSLPPFIRDNYWLLHSLQNCHDTPSVWKSEETLREVLAVIAKSNNLDNRILADLHFENEEGEEEVGAL